jgi:alkylation response protein AidB-like acyl-CoA dehydrogenase
VRRKHFDDDHELFRTSVQRFVEREIAPHYVDWNNAGIVPRALFRAAGDAGFLGVSIPEEYGGGGVADFRYSQVLGEELQYAGVNSGGAGLTLQTDIAIPYFLGLGSHEQKARWLPGIASGELITAIAMTEPGTGSDLASITTSARRDGESYVVNGAKTFITNGINGDVVIVAVKTDPTQRHRGMSLLVVERGMEGFERGRNLDKVGLHAQDTAELFFNDVRVPLENRLGAEGEGFSYLVRNLPQERLSVAVAGIAGARAALGWTLDYVRERKAFGSAIADFQNTKFRLAEMHTEVDVTQVFVDACVDAHNEGDLSAEEAAEAKWWCTELHKRTVDTCLQLHGGYGYMLEYPIARAYLDARVTTIYAGTTEIMKEIIGRKLTRG